MDMFKNLKIRSKLLVCTGLTILLFMVALAIFWQSLLGVSADYEKIIGQELKISELARILEVKMLQARRAEKDFLARKDLKYVELVESNIAQLQETAGLISSLAKKSGAIKIAAKATESKGLVQVYLARFHEVVKAEQKKGLNYSTGLQGEFRHAAADIMALAGVFDEQLAKVLALRRYEKDYLLRHDEKYVKKVKEQLLLVNGSLLEIAWDKSTQDKIKKAINRYKKGFEALVAEDAKSRVMKAEMTRATHAVEPLVKEITALAHERAKVHRIHTATSTQQAVRFALGVGGVALIAGFILSFYIATVISRPLQKVVATINNLAKGDFSSDLYSTSQDETGQIIQAMVTMVTNLKNKAQLAENIAHNDLRDDVVLASDRDSLGLSLRDMSANLNQVIHEINIAAEEIASGSGQVADSSQSLSQGASEQAASLEQITSSMTEMASQTRTNAENATVANSLAGETEQAAERGNKHMQEMVTAMEDISGAGQKISKIIKTIDEIAFQTNLLALNAAVEAARAGRHGKGFAVVAEEVRNLAARSAKAAKETAELIEGSVAKTARGTEIANRTADGLNEIVTSVSKVNGLVAEIAAASNEQAEGISQVNIGISQIDQVTQQNTANAEEGASAAEELSSQASLLKEMMERFKIKHQTQGQTQRPPHITSGPSAGTAHSGEVIDLDNKDFGSF